MKDETKPIQTSRPRRWLRFSLRTLIAMVAVVAVSIWGYRRWEDYHTFEVITHPAIDLIPIPSHGALTPMVAEIKKTIQPDTWDSNGGYASIHEFNLSGSLIVRNNRAAHRSIKAYLDRKRDAKNRRPGF